MSETEQLIARCLPSVVQVLQGAGTRGRGRSAGGARTAGAGTAGAGTGIVVDSSGLVLTNHHVVAGGGDLALRWSDGQTLPATVRRSNPRLDLALLKVATKPLPALAFGDSARARIGERVFAIGNPWGEPWVVTTGIISGIGRRATPAGDATLPFIRSDVQLAPGNSGGPMLNARGEVIGINAMIWGGDLSIAIPGNNARAWLDEVDGSGAPIAI